MGAARGWRAARHRHHHRTTRRHRARQRCHPSHSRSPAPPPPACNNEIGERLFLSHRTVGSHTTGRTRHPASWIAGTLQFRTRPPSFGAIAWEAGRGRARRPVRSRARERRLCRFRSARGRKHSDPSPVHTSQQSPAVGDAAALTPGVCRSPTRRTICSGAASATRASMTRRPLPSWLSRQC
jgi:hypothetical protein